MHLTLGSYHPVQLLLYMPAPYHLVVCLPSYVSICSLLALLLGGYATWSSLSHLRSRLLVHLLPPHATGLCRPRGYLLWVPAHALDTSNARDNEPLVHEHTGPIDVASLPSVHARVYWSPAVLWW